jgi:uncharacterized membrane protein YdjX (TVP38/TMEM64 family)
MTHAIEQLVHGAGIAAPIAFVAIYALLTVALVPGSAPSMAAGALFGAVWGTLLTVAFGMTSVAPRAYVAATALGIVPATVVFVALGSSMHDPRSPGFLVALAALTVVGSVPNRVLRSGRTSAEEPVA